jgi:predicted adenine nucleotide alpha hydrolase (AANH) superfamily ATPase
MRLLVHVCCGPCLYALLPSLRSGGHEVRGYFYNPNVHPYREFCKRLRAAEIAAERESVPMTVVGEYGLTPFLRSVVGREEERCARCYALRLGRAAQAAAADGMEGFTTTLLASSHQDLEAVRRAARAAAAGAGVSFLDGDWRGEHDRAHEAARRQSLYRQQYCGCIYSEYDRYGGSGKRGREDG